MNKIKMLNKRMNKIILEVVLLSLFVFSSYFWWGTLGDLNQYRAYAESFTGSKENPLTMYHKERGDFDFNTPMSDEVAMQNLKPTVISLNNAAEEAKEYNFVVRFGKEAIFDYKFLNMSVNDNIYNIENLEVLEDDESYYVLFPQDKILGMKNLEVRIWFDESTEEENLGKPLTFEFLLKEKLPV